MDANADAMPGFAIFRAGEGGPLSDIMHAEPLSEIEREGRVRLDEAGFRNGHVEKVLFQVPGMSLTWFWFKSRFPLPRHSHDCDCLYYIVAGSLSMGDEELGPGDGFFVPADAPYVYTVGDGGVEGLEFRATNRFNFRMLANNPAFWSRAEETLRSRSGPWARERAPAAVLRGG